MRIKYKCQCMKVETEIDVPDRLPMADLMRWMDNCTMNVTFDHSQRSPHCRSQTIEYAAIPLPEGSDQIGTPATRQ